MEVLFEIHAITCRTIRTTNAYWRYIMEVKHPESFKQIAPKAAELVMDTLSKPKVVVREKLDPCVYLYVTTHVLEKFLHFLNCSHKEA